MEDLPVATALPHRLLGRVTALRGACARWLRARLRHVRGRHAVLLLTGIFFSAMMICMGYVADRATRAADAIDEAQRAQRLLGHVVEAARTSRASGVDFEDGTEEAESAPAPTSRDHVLFYVVGGER